MGNHILVAYATASGFTAGVADAIGQAMREAGASVDVQPARKVKDVSAYDAVVVGTGIRAGRVFTEAVSFLKRNQAVLRDKPVAYFAVCLTMKDDTEENRCTVGAYFDAFKAKAPDIQPVDIGMFAGGVDMEKLGFPFRMILKAMKSPEGDFRDWDAIRAWATGVLPKLTGR